MLKLIEFVCVHLYIRFRQMFSGLKYGCKTLTKQISLETEFERMRKMYSSFFLCCLCSVWNILYTYIYRNRPTYAYV